jgi:hypothetical protein
VGGLSTGALDGLGNVVCGVLGRQVSKMLWRGSSSSKVC